MPATEEKRRADERKVLDVVLRRDGPNCHGCGERLRPGHVHLVVVEESDDRMHFLRGRTRAFCGRCA